VFADLRSEGLKTLVAREQADRPGRYLVIATASAAETVAVAQVGGPPPTPNQRWLPESKRTGEFVRPQLYERQSGFSTRRREINQYMIDNYMPGLDVMYAVLTPEQRRAEVQGWINANILPAEALDVLPSRALTPRWVLENVEYHIDHKYSLAQHWVETGHNSADRERREIAGDFDNLAWIHARANLAKGSAGAVVGANDEQRFHYSDHPWVGPEFQSDLVADSGRTIAGEPFLDGPNGKPIK
jgi:hypothetical protein